MLAQMTWLIPVENLSILQGLQTTNKNLKTTLYLYGGDHGIGEGNVDFEQDGSIFDINGVW